MPCANIVSSHANCLIISVGDTMLLHAFVRAFVCMHCVCVCVYARVCSNLIFAAHREVSSK